MRKTVALFSAFALMASVIKVSAAVPNDAGNGGYGLICPHPEGKQEVLLLDFYEAELRSMPYSLGKDNSVDEKVELALKRLERLDPKRARRYQDRADRFMDNAKVVPDVVLEGKIDYVTTMIKKGCKIGLIAVQKKPRFEQDKLYTISQDLYDLMDDDHKAGLRLHEIVYQDALEKGQEDSVGTRYLIGMLASKKLETMSETAYAHLLSVTGLSESATSEPSLWVQDPIVFAIQTGEPFQLDVSSYFHEPSNRPVVFEIGKEAPKFLVMDPNGKLMGVPSVKDVGQYTFSLIANTEKEKLPVVFSLSVSNKPQDPDELHWTAETNRLFHARIGLGGNFRIIDGPSWITVTDTGDIFGTPHQSDAGENKFRFAVKEGEKGRVLRATITVFRNHHVTWKQEIDLGKPIIGIPWTLDLSKFTTAEEGDTIHFTAVGLPDWLTMTDQGRLSGTPRKEDQGTFKVLFILRTDHQDTSNGIEAFGIVVDLL